MQPKTQRGTITYAGHVLGTLIDHVPKLYIFRGSNKFPTSLFGNGSETEKKGVVPTCCSQGKMIKLAVTICQMFRAERLQ